MKIQRLVSFVAFAVIASCGGDAGAGRDVGSSGLATTIDSTADTVYARVEGAVPERALRHLVSEMSIAPTAEDTSLFTEVFEFDVAPGGKMLVFDRPSNSALLFNTQGTLERRVGRQGAGPGEFNSNGGMVALGDTGWAIWDSRNARITDRGESRIGVVGQGAQSAAEDPQSARGGGDHFVPFARGQSGEGGVRGAGRKVHVPSGIARLRVWGKGVVF